MAEIVRRSLISIAVLASLLTALSATRAEAQTATDAPLQISWEVRNRLRLFREERDCKGHREVKRTHAYL